MDWWFDFEGESILIKLLTYQGGQLKCAKQLSGNQVNYPQAAATLGSLLLLNQSYMASAETSDQDTKIDVLHIMSYVAFGLILGGVCLWQLCGRGGAARAEVTEQDSWPDCDHVAYVHPSRVPTMYAVPPSPTSGRSSLALAIRGDAGV